LTRYARDQPIFFRVRPKLSANAKVLQPAVSEQILIDVSHFGKNPCSDDDPAALIFVTGFHVYIGGATVSSFLRMAVRGR
jgi:hypothetical protein